MKVKNVNAWKTHCIKGKNLIAKLPCREIITLPDNQGFALKFKNALYHEDDVNFIGVLPGTGYLCVTFKAECVADGALISNFNTVNP